MPQGACDTRRSSAWRPQKGAPWGSYSSVLKYCFVCKNAPYHLHNGTGKGYADSTFQPWVQAVEKRLADPVHIDVVAVRMGEGHAVLTLSREHSSEWDSKFVEVIFSDDFHKRVPDGWRQKGKYSVRAGAFDVSGGLMRVRHVPSDEASFRQLMVAVRHAIERTNAAEPSEDPPIADSSLTPVLEDVFRTGQRGAASGTP